MLRRIENDDEPAELSDRIYVPGRNCQSSTLLGEYGWD